MEVETPSSASSQQREATSSGKKEGPYFGPPVPVQRRGDDPNSAVQKGLEGVLGSFHGFSSLISQRGPVRPVHGVTPTPLTPCVRDAARPSFASESDQDTPSDTLVKKDAPKPSTSSETKPSTSSGSRLLPSKSTNGTANNRVRTTSEVETNKVLGKVRSQSSKETHGNKSNTGASACQGLNGLASSLSLKVDGRKNLKRRSHSPSSTKTRPDAVDAPPTVTISTQEALESMQSLVQTPLTALDGAPFKFPPTKSTTTFDSSSSSSRSADKNDKKNSVSPVQARASHKQKAPTPSDDRGAGKSALSTSTTQHSDLPPKKRQPRTESSDDPYGKLGLALSSDESDDDDLDNAPRPKPLPNGTSKTSNGTAKTQSTESNNDKKAVGMSNCPDSSSSSSKHQTTGSASSSSSSVAPKSEPQWQYDDILKDLFGQDDAGAPPPPRDNALIKEKKEKDSTSSSSKSSKSSRHGEKAKDVPSVKSSAAANNVDCEMNGVQSPDSGFVDGSLDGGVDDVKPQRTSAGEEPSGKQKKKQSMKPVASIMGEVGRVSPLLSPVREFPPLVYQPSDGRASLKVLLDLTGVDKSDRSDLFNQPSTSSTFQQLSNELDDLPLSQRIAPSSSSSTPDANRKSGDKKLKKTGETAERLEKEQDKRADKPKKKREDEDDRMPKLSKEVPFRIKEEKTEKVKEKKPPPPVLTQPPVLLTPSASSSPSKVSDKQKLSKSNSSDSSKVGNNTPNKVKKPSVEVCPDAPPAKKPRVSDQQPEPAPLLVPKLEPVVKSESSCDFLALAPGEPAKLDLGANGELLNADYYQNKRARPIKHTADREADKLKRTLFYLESVVYFVLSVRALGEARGDASQSSRPPTMIKDTCDLLRQITNRFVQASAELPPAARHLVSRIQALSLRAQSVLCYRLYTCKQKTVHQNYNTLVQYSTQTQQQRQQQQGGAVGGAPSSQLQQNGCSPTESGYGTGGSSTGGNSARHTTTPSPTPSPASSTNSGGSTGGVPANHVTVPRDIDTIQKQQLGYLHQLMWSHRHWEDSTAKVHPDDQPFFDHLDRVCGPLKMDSTLAELSVYLATAVDWMRAEYDMQLR